MQCETCGCVLLHRTHMAYAEQFFCTMECIHRFQTTVQRHCVGCQTGLRLEHAIYMRDDKGFCSERCRRMFV